MTVREYVCEGCGQIYVSIRAALLCEDEDITADRDARRR